MGIPVISLRANKPDTMHCIPLSWLSMYINSLCPSSSPPCLKRLKTQKVRGDTFSSLFFLLRGEEEERGACMDLTIVSQKSPIRKNGCKSLLKIATFFIRRSSTAKKALISAESNEPGTDWKVIVGGVRPFHHVHQLEYPTSPKPPPMSFTRNDSFHDVLLPPPSPPEGSIDNMSRYASAEDLCSLDNSKEDEEAVEDDGMPNAIDLKAEEFITKFYEQIKQQRLEFTN